MAISYESLAAGYQPAGAAEKTALSIVPRTPNSNDRFGRLAIAAIAAAERLIRANGTTGL
jgi:hypothetical protein